MFLLLILFFLRCMALRAPLHCSDFPHVFNLIVARILAGEQASGRGKRPLSDVSALRTLKGVPGTEQRPERFNI